MHKFRAALPRPVHPIQCLIPPDFDQIEAAEEECVRQVQHGHSFTANDATANKCADPKIYSL